MVGDACQSLALVVGGNESTEGAGRDTQDDDAALTVAIGSGRWGAGGVAGDVFPLQAVQKLASGLGVRALQKVLRPALQLPGRVGQQQATACRDALQQLLLGIAGQGFGTDAGHEEQLNLVVRGQLHGPLTG